MDNDRLKEFQKIYKLLKICKDGNKIERFLNELKKLADSFT